jgi:hypothetical protein
VVKFTRFRRKLLKMYHAAEAVERAEVGLCVRHVRVDVDY